MPRRLNLLDHPVCLAEPARVAPSHWTEHIPFAMWLVSALRPRVFVELGTYFGTSYCAFCQAIAALGLPARAFAVDTWIGDPHNGQNGPEVLDDLRAHHDPLYGRFSTLIASTFDEAAERFADREIDLLHIDGYHVYEAAAHDFRTWQAKVSDRGVVLFHDVAEHMADFGVWRLWDELKAGYPSFTFEHEHGLGVLILGRDVPEEVRALAELDAGEASRVCAAFSALGRRLRLAPELATARAERDMARAERVVALHEKTAAQAACEAHRLAMNQAVADREAMRGVVASCKLLEDRLGRIQAIYDRQLKEFQESPVYQAGARLLEFYDRAAPAGSARRRIFERSMRLSDAIGREGAIGLVNRKAAQARSKAAERATIGRFAGQDWQADERPVFLLIRHNCGGGTERHVHDLALRLRDQGVRPVLVRPGDDGRLVWEEVGVWQGSSGGARSASPTARQRPETFGVLGDPRPTKIVWCCACTRDRESIGNLLDRLQPVHAHVHHLSGVPDQLVELLREREVPYDWTIHDYHAICPRIHLIGARGIYCGEPEPAVCNACLSRLGDDNGNTVSETITGWRERFRRHLAGARQVFAPSEDSAGRIRRYMPGVRVAIRPHPEEHRSSGVLAKRLKTAEPVRVLVLGTIVRTKGSERLLACARDARERRLPLEFHIVGTTDRKAQLGRLRNVFISGPYREADVFDHLAAASCHLAFVPTVCPESFMYTLSTIMAAGFYTVCYDLGAQAERLRAWGWGKALPLESGVQFVNETLISEAQRLAAEPGDPPSAPLPAVYPDLLTSYYGLNSDDPSVLAIGRTERAAWTAATPRGSGTERNLHAHLY
jgi:glycosyltransferase involved in cell wall biosynthesis